MSSLLSCSWLPGSLRCYLIDKGIRKHGTVRRKIIQRRAVRECRRERATFHRKFTFDVVGSVHVLLVGDRPDLEQPLSRSVHVRPPAGQREITTSVGNTGSIGTLNSLVHVLDLIGPGSPQRVYSSFAHQSSLRLRVRQAVGVRLALNPLYTVFRVQ